MREGGGSPCRWHIPRTHSLSHTSAAWVSTVVSRLQLRQYCLLCLLYLYTSSQQQHGAQIPVLILYIRYGTAGARTPNSLSYTATTVLFSLRRDATLTATTGREAIRPHHTCLKRGLLASPHVVPEKRARGDGFKVQMRTAVLCALNSVNTPSLFSDDDVTRSPKEKFIRSYRMYNTKYKRKWKRSFPCL